MEQEKVKLWSNLKIRPTTRTEIQCPKGLRVSTDDFFEELKQKLSDNELPAMAELCEIQWDASDNVQKRIMIKYSDTNIASNIIRILIGLDSVGNFAYIEEKTVIIPPELPEKPREKKDDRGCLPVSLLTGIMVSFWIGIIACFSSKGFGVVSIIFGLFLLGCYIPLHKEFKQWNTAADKEKAAYENAWETWEKQVVEIIHMSNRDDIFGRFILAVSSTVEQVIKVLYIDKQAAVIDRSKEEWTQKQIEEELEKRRKEFK